MVLARPPRVQTFTQADTIAQILAIENPMF